MYRASSYPTASSRFDSLLQRRPSISGQRFVNGFFDRPYRSQNIAQTLVELVSVSLSIDSGAVLYETLCSIALSNTIDLNVREPTATLAMFLEPVSLILNSNPDSNQFALTFVRY